MTRELALGLMVALGILTLAAMVWSIAKRRRHGDAAVIFPGAEVVAGEVVAAFSVLHVATTPLNKPLERVWAKPLAYRAKTTVQVRPGGVSLILRGEGEVGIVASAIVAVSRATWTIDKAVDPDGLIVISWRHDDSVFDTYLRSVDQPADTVISTITSVTDIQQEEAN